MKYFLQGGKKGLMGTAGKLVSLGLIFGAQEMISLVITHKWILACFYCVKVWVITYAIVCSREIFVQAGKRKAFSWVVTSCVLAEFVSEAC